MKHPADAAMRAIENAEKNPRNPFVLNGLFAIADEVHNRRSEDDISRWMAAVNLVARRCSDQKSTRKSAFEILKAVFNRRGQSVNVRFYALGAMYLLGTESALPVFIEASKDHALLKEIPHMHEWIDSLVEKLLIRGWKGDDEKVLEALGAALGTNSEEMRIFFSDRLLRMNTRAAHKVLVEKSLEQSNECLVAFLIRAYDLKYCGDAFATDTEFSDALLKLFDRARNDREFHIAPEALRPLVEKAVRKSGQDEKDVPSKTEYIMERLCPSLIPPGQPRPMPRRHAKVPAQLCRGPRLTLVNGGKNPELPR